MTSLSGSMMKESQPVAPQLPWRMCYVKGIHGHHVVQVVRIDDENDSPSHNNPTVVYACKRLVTSQQTREEAVREVNMHWASYKLINGYNEIYGTNMYVVKIHGYIHGTLIDGVPKPDQFYLVMDYYREQTLIEWRKSIGVSLTSHHNARLIENQLRPVLRSILQTLHCFHRRNLLHGDIKCENIFYDNGKVRMGDFGCMRQVASTLAKQGKRYYVGTAGYVAPEMMNRHFDVNYCASDIWSLAVTVFELLEGKFFLHHKNVLRPTEFPMSEYLSDELYDLFRQMVVISPSQRITAGNALRHKFFTMCSKVSDIDNNTQTQPVQVAVDNSPPPAHVYRSPTSSALTASPSKKRRRSDVDATSDAQP